MKKKVMSLIMAASLMVGVLAGCATTAAPAAAPAAEPAKEEAAAEEPAAEEAAAEEKEEAAAPAETLTIGFDMNSNQCAYCLKFANYIDEFAKKEGFNTIITQSDGDVLTQISNAENMIAQGADIIAGIWGDRTASLPVAAAAEAADIVCVSTLTSLDNEGDGYAKYIYLGSENYDGGHLQGEWLAENLPEGAGLWLLSGSQADQQSIDRVQGCLDALKEAGRDDVEVVAQEYTDNYMDKGIEIYENWLQAYDHIDCVVGTADLQIVGAIQAAKNANRMDDTIFVGFDGQDVALDAVKAGEMGMTVFQNAKAQAEEFVKLCVRIRDGEDPTTIEDINVPFETITIDNVDNYEW